MEAIVGVLAAGNASERVLCPAMLPASENIDPEERSKAFAARCFYVQEISTTRAAPPKWRDGGERLVERNDPDCLISTENRRGNSRVVKVKIAGYLPSPGRAKHFTAECI